MAKSMVHSFNKLARIQVGKCFVLRSNVEIVNDETPGEITVRTTSGSWFVLKGKEATEFLTETGFNKKY